jgi:hypothetical protein
MRYLFITGWQRSGTTLITRALNAHPRIVIVYQPFFDYFEECRNIFYRDYLNKAAPKGLPLLDSIAPHHQALKRSFPQLQFSGEDIASLAEAIENRVEGDPESAPLLVGKLSTLEPGPAPGILLNLLRIIRGSYGTDDTEIVGFKELYCEPFIDILSNHFGPKFSAIHMLRDPRGVYASRNAGSQLSKKGTRYPLMFIAEGWRRSYWAYEEYEKRIPAYIPVFFENLVLQPEEELRKILSELRVDYDPNVLRIDHYLDGLHRPWSGNSSHYTRMKRFEESTITKWMHVLDPVEVGSIEHLLSREMIAAGYSLQSSPLRVLDFLRFQERTDELVDWLRGSDYELSALKKLGSIYRTTTRQPG